MNIVKVISAPQGVSYVDDVVEVKTCDSTSITSCIQSAVTELTSRIDKDTSVILTRRDVFDWANTFRGKIPAKDVAKLLKDSLEEMFEVKRIPYNPRVQAACGPNKTYLIHTKWSNVAGNSW